MEDCYVGLNEDQEIMFNTSFPCAGISNSSSDLYWDIIECSEYEVNIIPEFFKILNGSASSVSISTTPGNYSQFFFKNIG